MEWTDREIEQSYLNAKDKKAQIYKLAELNGCSIQTICEILRKAGIEPQLKRKYVKHANKQQPTSETQQKPTPPPAVRSRRVGRRFFRRVGRRFFRQVARYNPGRRRSDRRRSEAYACALLAGDLRSEAPCEGAGGKTRGAGADREDAFRADRQVRGAY